MRRPNAWTRRPPFRPITRPSPSKRPVERPDERHESDADNRQHPAHTEDTVDWLGMGDGPHVAQAGTASELSATAVQGAAFHAASTVPVDSDKRSDWNNRTRNGR